MTTQPWTPAQHDFDSVFTEIETRFPSYFKEVPYNDNYMVWLFLVDRFLARSVQLTRSSLLGEYDWRDDFDQGFTPEESCQNFFENRMAAFFDA